MLSKIMKDNERNDSVEDNERNDRDHNTDEKDKGEDKYNHGD